jgi:hypothetical protein
MGQIRKQNGEVIHDVFHVADTADGYIRVERSGGSSLFIKKSEVAEVDAIINHGVGHHFGVIKRKLNERKKEKFEQQEMADREEVELVTKELLPLDQKLNECHCCGEKHSLTRSPFGLAKIVSSTRNWSLTGLSIASTALAAVFIPIASSVPVRIHLPRRKQFARLLRLDLTLCSDCRTQQKVICKKLGITVAWQAHPWWHKAMKCGYTEFIPGDELGEWTPLG